MLNGAVKFYWLVRLFDSNEKQKFFNRPANGAFTLISHVYQISVRYLSTISHDK